MNRRYFIITIFSYFMRFLVGLFSFASLANIRKDKKHQITFTTHLPYKMSKSEYELFKKSYSNSKESQALSNQYKKTIYKEQYTFTGTQSIWTLIFENEKSLIAFRKKLKSLTNDDKMKKLNFTSSAEYSKIT